MLIAVFPMPAQALKLPRGEMNYLVHTPFKTGTPLVVRRVREEVKGF